MGVLSGAPLSSASGKSSNSARGSITAPRKNMGADLRALLDHADADIAVLRRRQLLQPDRRREPGRTGAHHDDVECHRFPFQGLPHLTANAACIAQRTACFPMGRLW